MVQGFRCEQLDEGQCVSEADGFLDENVCKRAVCTYVLRDFDLKLLRINICRENEV